MLESLQPIHPKLVHFPIALFLTALLFELISLGVKKDLWHQGAVRLYLMATLLTPIVVLTGNWEEERLHLHHPLLETHEHFAQAVMWTALASLPVLWFFHRKRPELFRPVFLLFLIATAACVALAGHYGGMMVFRYGVGTLGF